MNTALLDVVVIVGSAVTALAIFVVVVVIVGSAVTVLTALVTIVVGSTVSELSVVVNDFLDF